MRRLFLLITLLVCSKSAFAIGRYDSICEQGNASVSIPGTVGSGAQKFQRSYPNCTITVYNANTTTLATIWSDFAMTPKPNPFTADSTGRFIFYAASANYDIRFSGAGITSPWVIQNVPVFDSFPPIIVPAGPVTDCGDEPGTDASAKLISCIANLPSSGGTAVATSLSGNQTWSSCPFTGVVKPVLVILGSGTTTAGSFDCTAPPNVEVEMPAGAIYNSPGNIFNARLSPASSITQHFTPSTIAQLPNVQFVHSRWFDDGTHTEVAIQKAIDSAGSPDAQTIVVDDIMSLANPVLILSKNLVLTCNGDHMLSAANQSVNGGAMKWAGGSGVPMIEIKNTIHVVIERCHIYGNSVTPPRSLISTVTNGGQGELMFRNLSLGYIFGDTGFQATNAVDGIRIGDSYDGGLGFTNDQISITDVYINGMSNAAVRQSSIQNGLAVFSRINVTDAVYGLQLVSSAQVDSLFCAACTGSLLFAPGVDDFGQAAVPWILGTNVQSENSGRYILQNGGGLVVDIKGAGFTMAANFNPDKKAIKSENEGSTSIKITSFLVQNFGTGPGKVSLKASDSGHAAVKLADIQYSGDPLTMDSDTYSGFESHFIRQSMAFMDSSCQINVTPCNYFPLTSNVLMGNAGDFVPFDTSVYQIPTRKFRVGDTQNYAGAWQIETASDTLKPVNGNTTVTSVGLIPANSILIGVTSRNLNSILTSGGTLQLGSGSSATKWNANLSTAANGSTSISDWNVAVTGPVITHSAENVVATVSGGTFSNGSGWIQVTAFFMRMLPPPGLQ